MKEQYNHQEIESLIQEYWETNQTFKVTEEKDKEKYYCLSMIPYPSGHLHMGHVRNYTIGDVLSRYHRMLGKNVLQPIGWDAFGLPAESAALEHNTAPSSWTYSNIAYMKNQMKILGFSYDWSREITTCQAEYYVWEQWFFIYLYEKGLVYKKTSAVNWCPHDMTILANEQVINGCCWRCQSIVENKEVPQWFIKITHYADELLNDLDTLVGWPENVKIMQRNWIGRSEGIEIYAKITNSTEKISIYTTRPDTIMGVTYIAVAANHPILIKESIKNPLVNKFIQKCCKTKISESELVKIEKNGVLTNLTVEHPITGKPLPLWVANYVMMQYGTGAIIGVPGHNQHDWEFSKKYHIPIKPVILMADGSKPDLKKCAMTEKGITFNSGEFDNLSYNEACIAVTNKLIENGLGKRTVHYRLRDWSVSRQRYWGAPIPMVTLKNGSAIPVPIDQLPILLPEGYCRNGHIIPINTNKEWAKTTINGQPALRETDTFDTFMESAWYYARYTCPEYTLGMLDPSAANYWLPVDQYIGGIEHAIMHLLYFRLFHKLLRDAGLVHSNEPVKRLLCQGMVLSDAFYFIGDKGEYHWVSPSNLTIQRDNQGRIMNAVDQSGNTLFYAGMTKMSKSKKNGIDIQRIINCYGADTVRLFIMFAAPLDMTLEWKDSGVEGAHRFLKKIWKLVWQHTKNYTSKINHNYQFNFETKLLRRSLHKTIDKVSNDIEHRQMFHTAIAAIMEFTNKLIHMPQTTEEEKAFMQEALLAVVRMLHPFTPHISFVLWKALSEKGDIDYAPWPQVDQTAIIDEQILIIIQINGKIRGKIIVAADSHQDYIQSCAQKNPAIQKYLSGSKIKKIIYVPGKLINLVLNK
ncbi:leucine--tRNA ligase [Candidatus Erwinia haradaeae]|uniref:Leucine--tRNA ligase n=1 Tax=Candidatus Erwinia haradaeae TaxID=1922217 RepID=A0A451D2B5_9GAMM|nr:leucine--tRNA ligase [Candidatus Erwinia haradaeae]VFP79755.1 Leucine--tRNA ligase [Candidatus Erwinia haradaeae]